MGGEGEGEEEGLEEASNFLLLVASSICVWVQLLVFIFELILCIFVNLLTTKNGAIYLQQEA